MPGINQASPLIDTELKVGTGAHPLTNTSPTATTFRPVPNLTACAPSIGFTYDIAEYRIVGNRYNSKIPTIQKFGDLELEMLFIQGQAEMDLLKTACKNGTQLQFMLTTWQDATKTNGAYSIWNGYVASLDVQGDGTKVATQKVKVVITSIVAHELPLA